MVLEPGWVELFASNDDDDENGNREEFPFYMQTSTGILSRTPPNYFSDSCGGALCDEPGLGKTVTVCALILATRGSYAPPPKGLTIKFEHPEKENMEEKVPYYVDEPVFEEEQVAMPADDAADEEEEDIKAVSYTHLTLPTKA